MLTKKLSIFSIRLNTVFILFTIIFGIDLLYGSALIPAILFIAWATSPFFYLFLLNSTALTKTASILVLLLIIITGVSEIAGFAYWRFIKPGGNSPMLYMYAPFYQWALLLLATIPVFLFNLIGKKTGKYI